jgi:hypothetical protein
MLNKAIPVVIITMLVGFATAAALWFKRYMWARVLVVVLTALLLVLFLAVFVLAHYSGSEQTTKTAPAEVKTTHTSDRSEGADSVANQE